MTDTPHNVPEAPVAIAGKRHLRLVHTGVADVVAAQQPAVTQRLVLTGWRQLPKPLVRPSAWAGLLEQMWPGESLRIVHTLQRCGPKPMAYAMHVDLLQSTTTRASQTPRVLPQALLSLLPGQQFDPVSITPGGVPEVWPLRAVVTPLPIPLAERQGEARVGAERLSPMAELVPFPADLPNWALTVPFDEPLSDALQLELHVRAVEPSDSQRQRWLELLQRLGSGNVLAFQPGSPVAVECADPDLKEGLLNLLQTWLRQPRPGFTLHLAVRSPDDLSTFVLQRIARDVFGRMPFQLRLADDDTDELACPSPLLKPGKGMGGLFAADDRLDAFGLQEITDTPDALPEGPGSIVGHAGRDTPVILPDAHRLSHVAVLGGSGTGKSSFMLRMMTEDIRRGFGVGLIDVHGDLYDRALALIPQADLHRVVTIDIEDPDFSVALNPMQGTAGNAEMQNYVANQILEIIEKLFETEQSTGPMMRNHVRHALRLAMCHPEGGTLADAARVFEDPAHRRWLLSRADRQLVDYFKAFLKTDGENGFANWLPYLMARFNPFVQNPVLRRMLCRPSTLNLRQAMDEGWIVLFRLSKSVLQELECSLLGTLLLLQFQVAALGRAKQPESQRRPFHLFVDEFHTFANDSTPALFREARKFGLGLTVATQSLSSLRHRRGGDLANAVLANTATKVLFRLSPMDAHMLDEYVEPGFTARDLSRCPNYQAVVSLTGADLPAFRLHAAVPKPTDTPVCIDTLRAASGRRHGTPMAEAQALLAQRDLTPAVAPQELP